jgi:hypothetical protein
MVMVNMVKCYLMAIGTTILIFAGVALVIAGVVRLALLLEDHVPYEVKVISKTTGVVIIIGLIIFPGATTWA